MLINKLDRESAVIKQDKIPEVEKHYNAKYVIDTEHEGLPVAVFYGAEPHPDSGSRYFALYWALGSQLMITNGAFIEDQEIACVIADDGEIIHSRYRHDYRVSADGSVFIDGGRAYTRTGLYSPEKYVTVIVRNGEVILAQEGSCTDDLDSSAR